MKISPVKNCILKNRLGLLGSITATAMLVSSLQQARAQDVDSLDIKKDTIELCRISENESLVKDDVNEFEKASKAFVLELLAALAVVGTSLLGAWEPKDKNSKS